MFKKMLAVLVVLFVSFFTNDAICAAKGDVEPPIDGRDCGKYQFGEINLDEQTIIYEAHLEEKLRIKAEDSPVQVYKKVKKIMKVLSKKEILAISARDYPTEKWDEALNILYGSGDYDLYEVGHVTAGTNDIEYYVWIKNK